MRRAKLTTLPVLIFLSMGVISAHALLNTFFHSFGFTLSYLFWSLWALLAAVACLWRASHCPVSVQTHWRLAATSLFLIFVATAIEAPAEIFFKAVPTVASIGDFFFFSAFVPILISITLPDDSVFDRFTFVLESLQAAACACLAYTVLFGVFPFSSEPAQAMSYAPLEFVYDAEYMVVVLLAALRFFLGTRNAADRYFFRYLLLFAALYAATSGVYNHYVGKYSLTNGMDALNDIPLAAFALAAVFAPAADLSPSQNDLRRMLVRLIDNARPVFLSLALIGLSAVVAVRHFIVAFAFIFGAFILYSLRAARLKSKIEYAQAALRQSNVRLSEMALLDGLTGISNRRSFDQILAGEWARAQRTRQPLSVLLIDLDHFKQINDSYGHHAGDACLRRIARVLNKVVDRPTDRIARYGGDEFAALLGETNSAGAATVANRIRVAMEKDDADEDSLPTTLSIGIATWTGDEESGAEQLMSPRELMLAADGALYAAKQKGRDRVELFDLYVQTGGQLSSWMEPLT